MGPPGMAAASFVIAVAMPALWAGSVLLMRASQLGSQSRGEDASMIVMLEVVKLAVALLLYVLDVRVLGSSDAHAETVSLWWAVPALCYAAVNCLSYSVIAAAGPTRYSLLSHLKVAPTAVLARVVLSRPLSRLQWLSVAIVGVGLAASDYCRLGGASLWTFAGSTLALPLSAVAAVLSAVASVSSERLYKKHPTRHILWQNAQLYVFSSICSVALLPLLGDPFTLSFLTRLNAFSLAAVAVQVVYGLVLGWFLRAHSSVAKLFVAATGTLLVSIASVPLFGETWDTQTSVGVVVVGVSVVLYNYRTLF